jgi:hypothetical protein
MNNVKEIKLTIAGYYEIKEEGEPFIKLKYLVEGRNCFFKKMIVL